MADYITLLGAEQVQSAANTISSAANEMQRAADTVSCALERHQCALELHQNFMTGWLDRFEQIVSQIGKPPTRPAPLYPDT